MSYAADSLGDPPPYIRHGSSMVSLSGVLSHLIITDWISALNFWSTCESWSISKKLREDWRFSKAVLKTADWKSVKSAIQARNDLTKAFHQARYLRHQVEKGTLDKREADRRVKSVFGQFAESMNKVELWTGEG